MSVYEQLMEEGYKLNEIDIMDFFGYLDVLVYKILKKEQTKYTYIDECGFL